MYKSGTFPSTGVAAVRQCGGIVIDNEEEYQKLLAEQGKDRVLRVAR